MAGSLSEWFFTWGGFCGWYFIYPMVPGELAAKRPQKAPETTKTSKALGTPQKKQRNRQNVGKPPNKSLGRGKNWGQEASQQKQRPRPLRGEKTPTWGEGFPPPWALMCIHISKGACQKSYGSGKLKKNTWEGLFFSDDPKSSNFGSAGLTWRPLWPSIPQVPWR